MIPRIMITAAASGSGKTVTTCALIEALKKRELKVTACKCGPDYIDPMFHREVLGVDSENLDLFFSDEKELRENFYYHAKNSDIAVIEGVMGYFDGMFLDSTKASSYEVAKALKTPVILILPCKGMAMSILAVLKGIIEFQEENLIKGIILNRVSEMLYPRLKEMIEKKLFEMGHSIKVLGFLPEREVFQLESRHLGLCLPEEIKGLKEQIKRSAELLENTVELDTLYEIARQSGEWEEVSDRSRRQEEEKIRIAIARDEAFGFYYKDNMELLKEKGCQLVEFSPLNGTQIPEQIDGMILGGGYPEIYAKRLSENDKIKKWVKDRIAEGMPCLAECGGFLYLLEQLEDMNGQLHNMVGVIEGKGIKKDRLVRFGYIEVEGRKNGTYLKEGEVIRAHEFHYWDADQNGRDCVARKPDGKRSWEAVHMKEKLFAGFPHLYWKSNPEFIDRFLKECIEYRQTRREDR